MANYKIDKINKKVILEFAYDEEIVRDIKLCDYNASWNPEEKFWTIPINNYSKNRISSLIKKHGFKKQLLEEELDVEHSYAIDDNLKNRLFKKCEKQGWTYIPRLYQIEALNYALEKNSFINGDDVGLGKTFESIMYTEITNSFPCLVITPASVKYNWKEKWSEIVSKNRSISVIETGSGEKNNDWNADVIIINYDILGKKAGKGSTFRFDELIETKWKMLICDEAHYLKNTKARRSNITKRIARKVDKKQLLTGTATQSKPVELWNLLDIVEKTSEISNSWKQYVYRYCGAFMGFRGLDTSGATNMKELNKRLRESCYLRREQSDVLTELPMSNKQVIYLPITNKSKIKKATKDIIEYIKQTKGEEASEKAMEAEHLVALSELRKLSIEGKLKAIEQYISDWKESGLKLLVFGVHKEQLEYLCNKFNGDLIAGGVSSKKKQEIVNDFKENDKQFLFLNIQSGGTGIDGLQKSCSNMLILELPWLPSDLTQVFGRLVRSGQTKSVNINFMLSKETIDLQMWEMLEEKEFITTAVNKGVNVRKQKSGMQEVLKKILLLK